MQSYDINRLTFKTHSLLQLKQLRYVKLFRHGVLYVHSYIVHMILLSLELHNQNLIKI